jgi:hypothetical protein
VLAVHREQGATFGAEPRAAQPRRLANRCFGLSPARRGRNALRAPRRSPVHVLVVARVETAARVNHVVCAQRGNYNGRQFVQRHKCFFSLFVFFDVSF